MLRQRKYIKLKTKIPHNRFRVILERRYEYMIKFDDYYIWILKELTLEDN